MRCLYSQEAHSKFTGAGSRSTNVYFHILVDARLARPVVPIRMVRNKSTIDKRMEETKVRSPNPRWVPR
jgi:hypothetical protein